MLNAGRLRHRLVVYESDNGQDSDTGEEEITWTELATAWGSFEPYSTKDFIAAAATQNQTSARSVVRYRSDISAGMRVVFRNKTYEIVNNPLPDADSGLEYMTLMLAEVTNV